MTRREVIAKWRMQERQFETLSVLVDGAKLIGQLLHDLEAAETAEAAELVPLARAAEESGYSVDHVSRLVRNGKIPNAGRKGAPRVRRGDLPRRVARNAPQQYDPGADALSLLSQREVAV